MSAGDRAEHRPFIAAIIADHEADLPRLLYADFLEETGTPVHLARAKYIRAAIQPNLPAAQNEAYCRTLLHAHMREWAGHLGRVLASNLDTVRWRRGFPYWVPLTPSEVYDHGARLFEEHPLQAMQLLPESAQQFDWLFTEDMPTIFQTGAGFREHTFLSRLTHLQLGPQRGYRTQLLRLLRGVMHSALLVNLGSLDLADNPLEDTDVVSFLAQLHRSVFADTLTVLDLSHCTRLTDAGANTLATAESLKALQTLRLVGVPLGADVLEMLHQRYGDGLIL